MDIETLRSFLAWCTLFNWILLLIWWLFIAVAGDWVYAIHTKWFEIPRDSFETVHYAGMAFFKIAVFVFNLVPYLVLRLVF
jgi:hypothetical protein